MSWIQNGDEINLTEATDSITIDNLSNKRYSFMLNFAIEDTSGNLLIDATLNNSTNVLYSYVRNNNNGTNVNGPDSNLIPFSSGINLPAFEMIFMYSEVNVPKAGIIYQVRNGGGDEDFAPRRMVVYWNSVIQSAITRIDLNNSGVGDYSPGFNFIIISSN